MGELAFADLHNVTMRLNPINRRTTLLSLLVFVTWVSLSIDVAADTRASRPDAPSHQVSGDNSRSPIRFAGFVSLDDGTSVNLVDKRSGETFWAKVGQTYRDITILEFSRESRTVDIRVNGAALHLELSEASIKRFAPPDGPSRKFTDADIALAASQIVLADRMEEIRRRKASRAQDAALTKRGE